MQNMRFTLPEIAASVRDLGYRGKELFSDGYSCVESATSGKLFYVFCYDKESNALSDESVEASLVRFACNWVVTDEYDENRLGILCNWFNSERPFSKSYIRQGSEDKLAVLEADLYVLDGMSQAAFKHQLSFFIGQLEFYASQLPRCLTTPKSQLVENHNKALSLLHTDGDTTQIEQAIRLYRYNAHLGFAGSQNNFGDLFEDGDLVPKDLLVAMYWYARSSERGEPTAYYSIASLLSASTENVDALVLAAKYAILAANQLPDGKNKASAVQIRETLREILSKELYEYAQELAKSHQPLVDEPWKMEDAPGPPAISAPGSSLMN